MLIAKSFKVSGLVQGVYFRASTQALARDLNIVGYVRNLPSGEIEGVACGLPDKMEILFEWLSQGPPAARVDNVQVEDHEVESWSNFDITL